MTILEELAPSSVAIPMAVSCTMRPATCTCCFSTLTGPDLPLATGCVARAKRSTPPLKDPWRTMGDIPLIEQQARSHTTYSIHIPKLDRNGFGAVLQNRWS